MRKIYFLVVLLTVLGCRPFIKEYQAKQFVKTQMKAHYDNAFETRFLGTWHEFGKIYGFQFLIVENKEKPIAIDFYLPKEKPFYFNKEAFESEYQRIKEVIKDSETLEKKLQDYYPNVKVLFKKIKNEDNSYRYVINIYTAEPLTHKDETIKKLDSLSMLVVGGHAEKEVFYNFYFPEAFDNSSFKGDRFEFFSFEHFSEKYIFHYRVDFEKQDENFAIVARNLHDHFNDAQKNRLKKAIESWKMEHIDFKDWKLSLLYDSSIDRDLQQKKFMLENEVGTKKVGYIAIETLQIIMEN